MLFIYYRKQSAEHRCLSRYYVSQSVCAANAARALGVIVGASETLEGIGTNYEPFTNFATRVSIFSVASSIFGTAYLAFSIFSLTLEECTCICVAIGVRTCALHLVNASQVHLSFDVFDMG